MWLLDSLLEKVAIKLKPYLLNKKSIKLRLDEKDDHLARIAARSAFRGTPLEIPESHPGLDQDYSSIPAYYLENLKNGTFAEIRVGRLREPALDKIQERFTNGFENYAGYEYLKDIEYKFAAVPYIKTVFSVIIVVIGVGIWGGIQFVHAEQNKRYWASLNAPQTFQGDGFKATFPCSDVKAKSVDTGPDIGSSEAICSYYGGPDHTQIDVYSIDVEHFLTDKYSPSQEMACGSPNVYTGDQSTQTYYNEKRSIDGYDIIICGKGDSPTVARVQNGNTVFTLSALPADQKTTYSKLNAFLQGFQISP